MKYDRPDGSFIVSIVVDNVIKRLIDQGTKMENLPDGTILLYEIPPELNPRLASREVSDRFDSNYQISPEWTKQVIYMMQSLKTQYSYYSQIKPMNIPRVMWVRKDWNL